MMKQVSSPVLFHKALPVSVYTRSSTGLVPSRSPLCANEDLTIKEICSNGINYPDILSTQPPSIHPLTHPTTLLHTVQHHPFLLVLEASWSEKFHSLESLHANDI